MNSWCWPPHRTPEELFISFFRSDAMLFSISLNQTSLTGGGFVWNKKNQHDYLFLSKDSHSVKIQTTASQLPRKLTQTQQAAGKVTYEGAGRFCADGCFCLPVQLLSSHWQCLTSHWISGSCWALLSCHSGAHSACTAAVGGCSQSVSPVGIQKANH